MEFQMGQGTVCPPGTPGLIWFSFLGLNPHRGLQSSSNPEDSSSEAGLPRVTVTGSAFLGVRVSAPPMCS